MIDLLSLYVCFPISEYAIGSPENSFYPRAPVYMHYLLKDKKQIPLRTSPSSYKLKRSISLGESAFPLPRGGVRAHFAARKLLTSCGHKSRRSSCAQNSASYVHSIPTLRHSTPTRRRVCVCWREGEGDTPSYKLYNQVSLLDMSLRNVSGFAYRLMKVEVSHIYLPQSYALYNMICFEIGYCNQSDGFISHISPGIVINISGNQLVDIGWVWV